ncbi:MAG: Ig-like domain-containing protein [Archangium sp.]|nr:Ig-like domain-containing protein [Archangium sp.]MDP3571186.1 Ig-like domain-containing protein [Archangium sp.]
MKNPISLLSAVALLALTGCPKPPVELSSLALSPDLARLPRGETVQFVATALFTDGQVRDVTAEALWSVDDTFVGSASEEDKGLVTGLASGQTVVRARFGGKNVTRSLVVIDAALRELQLDPPHPVLPVGLSVPLKVTAIRSDGSKQDVTAEAIWSSSSPNLASVENAAVIGRVPGALTISASVQGLVVTAPVDVTNARVESIDVQPATFTLPIGITAQLTATALLSDGSSLDITTQAAWRSSASQIAFVSELPGEQGLVAARAQGTARITASIAGKSGGSEGTVTVARLLTLELGPASTTLANGTSQRFTATGTFSDGTTADLSSQVSWTSSNPAVFSVTAGLVNALGVGRAQLAVSLGSIRVSRELQITTATLTTLELRPSPAVVARGLTLDVTAIATFSDATQQDLTRLVVWRVADTSLATSSNASGTEGRITATHEGVTEVNATFAGVIARTSLTISAAALASVQVTPIAPTLPRGTTRAFTATGLFTDGTTQDLTAQATWTSSDASRVAVSSQGANRGEVNALSQGSADVRASVGGKSGSTQVTVSAAVLTAIDLSPLSTRIPLGVSVRFGATGRFSDGTTADLTTQVTWSSSAPSVASVSNAPGTEGEVRALSLGTTQLTAQLAAITGTGSVVVTDAAPTALELSPSSATIAVGLTRGFNAVATYSDGTSQDVTAQTTFSTLSSTIATVALEPQFARVTGRSAGTTRLVASAMGLTAQANVTITPAQLIGLSINPAALTLARGTLGQLSVEATWSDGTNADVTTQATWTSTDAAIVAVSSAPGSHGALTALTTGSATVQAQLGAQSASSLVTVSPATLMTIEVTPTSPSIPLGATQRFVATGRYSDGSAQNLSTQVTWSSSVSAVLSVSNAAGLAGLATASSQGSAVVSAAFGDTTGSTTAVVTAATLAEVQISPPQPRIAKETRITLIATGVWSDGGTQDITSSCTWTSGGPIATVSNAAGTRGRVSAISPGVVVITATCAGVAGSAPLTITNANLVSIQVTPSMATAAAGFTRPLAATGLFSDGSTQPFTDFVSWSSADPSKATVSSLGLVSARTQGSVLISAQALNVTGQVNFVVSAALLESIELAPSPSSVPKGLQQNFVAIGHFSDGSTTPVSEAATWSSSAPNIATVSNAAGSRGQATALLEGVTTISASLQGFLASATLTVTPASLTSIAVTPVTPSIAKGLSLQFAATGTFSDGSTRDLTSQVTWSAGDGAIASISNTDGSRGRALAMGLGTTTLSASLGSISGASSLTVTAAMLVSIGVTPGSPSVPRGLTLQLVATGVYTDGSTADLSAQVMWLSSDATRAQVSNGAGSEGLVQALDPGATTITATQGSFSGTTQLTVTPAVLQQLTLTPPSPSVAAGLGTSLTATGLYSDSSTQNLSASASWSSSDVSIATVSAGVISTSRSGTVIITATVGAISGQVTLVVTAAVLQQLQVTPQNVSRPKGLTQQFVAMGVFSDGSTAELTSSVTWASSDPAKVSLSNANGSRGLGSTPAIGAVTVSATLSGITGSTPFTVTAAQLSQLGISPTGSTASLGSVRQYVATGTYTDASTQNLTTQVAWSSSNQAVATISNANGSHGLATTLSTGVTSISASFGGFSAAANLVVIQNALTSIALTPASGGTALGYSRQFIAIGTYNDGTTQVITGLATWTTDDASVAIVSNADGSRGLLSTVGTGNVTVSATYQGVTGAASHAVTPAVLVAMSLSSSSVTINVAGSTQLTATGYFSDGSSQDLTSTATWSSSAPGVAQVSNASGSEGLVTGIAAGSAQISATQGSVSADANVTVN